MRSILKIGLILTPPLPLDGRAKMPSPADDLASLASDLASGTVPIARLPRFACGVVEHHVADGATAERLAALGLGVGATVTVLTAGSRPMVRVGETRIGLGPDLADAVRVRPQ